MNRTSSKATEGKTSFELVFGKRPDLSGLREWGDDVWVHQAGGDKLGGRAKRGRWIGYDEESNGSLIYFSDTGAIRIECNFRFDNSCSELEGKHLPISKPQNNSRPIPKASEAPTKGKMTEPQNNSNPTTLMYKIPPTSNAVEPMTTQCDDSKAEVAAKLVDNV